MDNSRAEVERLKAVIDLQQMLIEWSSDRPKMMRICREMGIDPEVAWHFVVTTYNATSVAIPEAGIELINRVFKCGVTLGYKYAMKKGMEKAFGEPADYDSDT